MSINPAEKIRVLQGYQYKLCIMPIFNATIGDNLQLFHYLKYIFKTAGRLLTDQTAKLLTIMYWPQNDNYSGGELILKMIYNIQNIYGGSGNFCDDVFWVLTKKRILIDCKSCFLFLEFFRSLSNTPCHAIN